MGKHDRQKGAEIYEVNPQAERKSRRKRRFRIRLAVLLGVAILTFAVVKNWEKLSPLPNR